jgi:hypothetical protein
MTNRKAKMNIFSMSPDSPVRNRPVASVHAACAIGLLAGCLLPAALRAAPLLRCEIQQGGTSRVVDTMAVTDPYSVKPIDINDRFRFKAVVIGDALRVEYIKIYVYTHTRREPMLLHQTSYLAPVASRDAQPDALTGINHVYSPLLERELRYGCALLETTP